MSEPSRVQLSLEDLNLGVTCRFDICDHNGLLLLGSGQPVTRGVVDQLTQRGVTHILVHPDDVDALTGAKRKKAAAKPGERQAAPPSLSERRTDRSGEGLSVEREERFGKIVATAVSVIQQIGNQIQSLSRPELAELCEVPNALTGMLLDDADQSIWSLTEANDHSLAKRCALMSLLAINTGIEMELKENEIMQLGTAGLIHDLGLFLLDERFRDPSVVLNANEVWEYRRHPTLVVNAFARLSIVSEEACAIANQVHERPDGSGFPRGLKANMIHPLARVLSVIDSYLTLVQPGPDRAAIVPHDAIAFLLHEVGSGAFDAGAMRAFLQQMALFPIGSQVELDDGQTATVVRRDGEHYSTPIVRVDGAHRDELLHTRDSKHKIVRPHVNAAAAQMRITPKMMPTLSLDMFLRA